MLTISELIDRLGGATKVARECGVLPSAVSNWGARAAIPAEHRVRLWRLATDAGIDWTPPGGEGLRLVPRDAAAEVAA